MYASDFTGAVELVRTSAKFAIRKVVQLASKKFAKRGRVALDANALTNALDNGHMAQVEAKIGNSRVYVSRRARAEYLYGASKGVGSKAALKQFLKKHKARYGKTPSSTLVNIQELKAQVLNPKRVVKFKDATVAAHAIRNKATLITQDKGLYGYMNAIGESVVKIF